MVPPLSLRRCANSSGGFPPTPTPLHCSSASAWSTFLPLGLIAWPTPTAPVCALVSMEMPFLLNCPPRRPHSLPNPLARPEGTCPCAVLHHPPDLWMLPKDLEDLHLQSLRCRICTVRYAFEQDRGFICTLNLCGTPLSEVGSMGVGSTVSPEGAQCLP